MKMEIIEKTGATLLKKILNANGRKTAMTGMHAGHAPKSIPVSEPANPALAVSIEQQGATFLL